MENIFLNDQHFISEPELSDEATLSENASLRIRQFSKSATDSGSGHTAELSRETAKVKTTSVDNK